MEEFMRQQELAQQKQAEDMRDVKTGLKANTTAINALTLDVAALKVEKTTEEKSKRKWPILVLPALGAGGATAAWNGKLIAGYLSRMLG
jgi:hypothetical protein